MGTIIEMDLPPWAENYSIYILAGVELLGYKFAGEPFYIKTVRCNQCGLCCRSANFGDWNRSPNLSTVGDACEFLIPEPGTIDKFRCSLGVERLFSCCVGEPRDGLGVIQPYCCVEYVEETRWTSNHAFIELPDWAEERVIWLCNAEEIGNIGYKYPGGPLMRKTSQCNQCGKCCEGLVAGSLPHYMSVADGKCASLVKHGNKMECQLQLHSSYTCVTGIPRDTNGNIAAYCSVEYEEVV